MKRYIRFMVDEPDNLVLRYLRRIDEKLDTLNGKVGDLVVRMGAVERDLAAIRGDFAALQDRMDGFDRRLDLVSV